MRPSSHDMVAFACALNERVLRTINAFERRGKTLVMTAELGVQLKVAALIYQRFVGKFDWRHTDAELAKCIALAEWCIARDAELTGGSPRPLNISPAGMVRPSDKDIPRAGKVTFLRGLLDRSGAPGRPNGHRRINGHG